MEILLVPNNPFFFYKDSITLKVIKYSDIVYSCHVIVNEHSGDIIRVLRLNGGSSTDVTALYEEGLSACVPSAIELEKAVNSFYANWKKTNGVEERSNG